MAKHCVSFVRREEDPTLYKETFQKDALIEAPLNVKGHNIRKKNKHPPTFPELSAWNCLIVYVLLLPYSSLSPL